MKLLTALQQNQISGGDIISLDETQYYVNTIGIPQNCVALFESTYDAGFKALNNPNASDASIQNAVDPFLDQIFDTGCFMYFGTFSDNLDNRIKI